MERATAVSPTLMRGRFALRAWRNIGLNGNINNTLKAFAPRIGVAYQFDSKTVVRMGYGREL